MSGRGGVEVRRMRAEGSKCDGWIVIVGGVEGEGGVPTHLNISHSRSLYGVIDLFIYLEGSPVAAFYHLRP